MSQLSLNVQQKRHCFSDIIKATISQRPCSTVIILKDGFKNSFVSQKFC